MNLVSVKSIVLHRTNYGEADKIATLLTEHGDKISIIAKGVRKPKSKLVAGVELFTVAEVTYAEGRGGLHVLRGAKIVNQHNKFLADYDKVQVAYSIVKYIKKNTDASNCKDYYDILVELFDALDKNDQAVTVELWAWLRVIAANGHSLQLDKQVNNSNFVEDVEYNFDFENGGFIQGNNGRYSAKHVKMLKICQSQSAAVICRVKNGEIVCKELNSTIKQFVEYNH